MTPLRVIVVEDQAPAREHLVDLVGRSPGVEIVAVCADGAAAIVALRSIPADVVLLDVQMPERDGFQVIEDVGVAAMPAVIFITAYDDHAVKAFDVRALDYLMKPFSAARVERALDLAREHVRLRRVAHAASQLAGLLGADRAEPPATDRIVVRQRGEVAFVSRGDVELAVARGNNVMLHTRRETFQWRATLSEAHARLGESFVKVHRSTLVNMQWVKPALRTRGSAAVLEVESGRQVKVSKAFRHEVERRLKN